MSEQKNERGQYPAWLDYGGPAWFPEGSVLVELPARVYPVVDIADDNYGTGIIVRNGGSDFVISEIDLGYPTEIGWPNGERNVL